MNVIRVLIEDHPRLNQRMQELIHESGLIPALGGDPLMHLSSRLTEDMFLCRSRSEVSWESPAHLTIDSRNSSKTGFAQEVALMPGPAGKRLETELCYLFVPPGLDKDVTQAIDEFLHMVRLRRIRPSDWSGRSTRDLQRSDDRDYRH